MNVVLIRGGCLTDEGARNLEALVLEIGPDTTPEVLRARIVAANIEIVPTDPGHPPTVEVRQHATEAIVGLAAHVVAGGALSPGSAERIAALTEDRENFSRIVVLEPAQGGLRRAPAEPAATARRKPS